MRLPTRKEREFWKRKEVINSLKYLEGIENDLDIFDNCNISSADNEGAVSAAASWSSFIDSHLINSRWTEPNECAKEVPYYEVNTKRSKAVEALRGMIDSRLDDYSSKHPEEVEEAHILLNETYDGYRKNALQEHLERYYDSVENLLHDLADYIQTYANLYLKDGELEKVLINLQSIILSLPTILPDAILKDRDKIDSIKKFISNLI